MSNRNPYLTSNRVNLSGFKLTVIILLALLVLYIVYPLIGLIFITGSINLAEELTRPEIINAFVLSITTATISTLILSIFGIPLALSLIHI